MLGEKEIGIFQSTSESLKTIAKAAEIYIEKSENEKKVGEAKERLLEKAELKADPRDDFNPTHIIRKSCLVNNDRQTLDVWALSEDFPNAKEVFEKVISKFKHVETIKENTDKHFDIPEFAEKSYNPFNDEPHYNVLFSGGYDSTALILNHLQKGEKVVPFFITFATPEFFVANVIIETLRYFYPETLAPLKRLFGSITSYGNENFKMAQQSFSAFLSAGIDEKQMRNCIATEIAFCMNDDALSYLDDLKAIYNGRLGTSMHSYRPPLEFPLIKTTHFKNSEVALEWEKKHNVVLPVSGLDCGEKMFAFHKIVVPKKSADADPWDIDPTDDVEELWVLLSGHQKKAEKPNKECEEFVPSYIIHVGYKRQKDIVYECLRTEERPKVLKG